MENSHVDDYLKQGCGRCPNYQTPECKVHSWQEELKALRKIALESGLQEEYKWSQPCYTLNGKNIFIITALKDYAAIAFFKGALLKDPNNYLVAPGKRSQAARQLRYVDVATIKQQEAVIKSFILEAIALEEAGKKVAFAKNTETIPEELKDQFAKDPAFEKAFFDLSPGRQRGYLIHFNQAVQSATRKARILKYTPTIMQGKGIHDDYRKGRV